MINSETVTPPETEKKPAAPVALTIPGTVEELEKYRVQKSKPTLKHEVDLVCKKLWPNPKFREYFKATKHEDAISGGKTDFDDYEASKMVSEEGIELELPLISSAKPGDLTPSVRRFATSHGLNRKKRREALLAHMPEAAE